MIFDPPAKSRRRLAGRFIWPLFIAIVVIVAVVVTAAGDQTSTELDYLSEVQAQTADLSRSGATIADVMGRVRDIDREEFTTAMDAVSDDVDVAVAFVAELPPTESLLPVWTLYRQAIEAWDRGVNGLNSSVLFAADNPDDDLAVDAVGDALADLRAGDRLYVDLQDEVERDEVPDPVSPLVTVVMFPAEGGINSLARSYVAAARSSTNALGLRPGLRVSQVVTEPEWNIDVESQVVVPATEQVAFSAIISNVGNTTSSPESLMMTFRSSEEGSEPILAEAEVPALAPNGQTTISFDPVTVAPEILYEVRMELVIANPDSDLDDNMLRIQFTVAS